MKGKTALFIILVLSMAVIVYAHEAERPYYETTDGNFVDWMDSVHNSMVQGLDPEIREEMETMHEGCMGLFRESNYG